MKLYGFACLIVFTSYSLYRLLWFCLLQVTVTTVMVIPAVCLPRVIIGLLRFRRRVGLLVWTSTVVMPIWMRTTLRTASPSVVFRHLPGSPLFPFATYKEWLYPEFRRLLLSEVWFCKFSSLPVYNKWLSVMIRDRAFILSALFHKERLLCRSACCRLP